MYCEATSTISPQFVKGIMLIYNDIFSWKGFGGKLRLGSGKCRLRIFDLTKKTKEGLAHLRPIIVIVSDVPASGMSIRSCAGHIATTIADQFNIKTSRIFYVEFYPEIEYGEENKKKIPERYEAVNFTWQDSKALNAKWSILRPPMLDSIKTLINGIK